MTTLADFTVSAEFDLTEVEASLRKWGVAVLPGWLKGKELTALRTEWDRIREVRNDDAFACVTRVGGEAADYASLCRSVPGAEKFTYVNQIFNSPQIAQLCERVVGRPYLLNEEVYATFDIGQDLEVAPSHFDKTWTLKFMVYLEDIVESGRGAFSVHPGSHHLGREAFRTWFGRIAENNAIRVGTPEYYSMDNDVLPKTLPECVEILAEQGSLIIFSTDTFHRGGFLAAGHERRIMRAHTYPGFAMLENNDILRKSSRYWSRSESWEVSGQSFSRYSGAGFVELKDHAFKRLQKQNMPLEGLRSYVLAVARKLRSCFSRLAGR